MIDALSSLVTPTIVSPFHRHVRIRHFLSDHRAASQGRHVHKISLQLSITQNPSHAQNVSSSLDSNFGSAPPKLIHSTLSKGLSQGNFARVTHSEESKRDGVRVAPEGRCFSLCQRACPRLELGETERDLCLRHYDFELVSDFDILISHLKE